STGWMGCASIGRTVGYTCGRAIRSRLCESSLRRRGQKRQRSFVATWANGCMTRRSQLPRKPANLPDVHLKTEEPQKVGWRRLAVDRIVMHEFTLSSGPDQAGAAERVRTAAAGLVRSFHLISRWLNTFSFWQKPYPN